MKPPSLKPELPGQAAAEALARAIDRKDRYTGGHARRVAWFAERIARSLGLDATGVERVRLAALLHDVGKIGIADSILKKPSPLTASEHAVMRTHPDLAPELLGDAGVSAEIAQGARHHHERWDGHGYPDCLAGESIPLVARIIAVADAFDAMVVSRPYRAGIPRARAMDEIRRSSGTQFDPSVVEAFVASVVTSC